MGHDLSCVLWVEEWITVIFENKIFLWNGRKRVTSWEVITVIQPTQNVILDYLTAWEKGEVLVAYRLDAGDEGKIRNDL